MIQTPWLKNYEDGVPPSLSYPKVPLTHFLQESADSFPQNIAMVFAGRKFSYQDLQDKINALANSLSSLGVKKGERIGLKRDFIKMLREDVG